MKRYLTILLSMLMMMVCQAQQSGLFIPSEKPLRAMQLAKAWQDPKTFCLQLTFNEGDSNYREIDLDLLDSAYHIAFDRSNPRLYTLTIEGYGNGNDSTLFAQRVESVYRYFTMRGNSVMPVRFYENSIHCNCHGDTTELIRYEVPTDRQIYDCGTLPESRMLFNGKIPLRGTVLVTFNDNPVECLGTSGGCFLPSEDSTIRAYYTQIFMPRGSLYAVRGTQDTCPPGVNITIEEHLDPIALMERYFLVPHRRQIILPVGYVVLHSSFKRGLEECKQTLPDSIFIRFPITEQQIEAGVRIFAKKMGSKGPEYKSLLTRKITKGPMIYLQAAINASQLDTIYIAKRIDPKEVERYLYPADSPNEQGAITIVQGKGKEKMEHYYKPFRLGRGGDNEYLKPFRNMLRIVEAAEEEPEQEELYRNDGDEELDK